MDIEAKKRELIKEFLKLESEEAILRLEKILKKETKSIENKKSVPMTLEQFNKRIDISLDDSQNGKLTEIDDLMSEIEKWS